MAGKGNRNDASRFRSVKRRSGSGEPLESLLKEARSIDDPYFRAMSIMTLLPRDDGLLEEALDISSSVKQEWRRAELWTEMMKLTSPSEILGPRTESLIISRMSDMRPGSGRSQAIKGAARYVSVGSIPALFEIARENKGFEKDDIRSLVRSLNERGLLEGSFDILVRETEKINDPYLRGTMYGYMHLQTRRTLLKDTGTVALERALKIIPELEGPRDTRLIGYLCRNCVYEEDVPLIQMAVGALDDIRKRVRALGDVATAWDRVSNREKALEALLKAESILEDLDDDPEKAGLLGIIASGMGRIGERERAKVLLQKGLRLGNDDPKIRSKILSRMEKFGIVEDETPAVRKKERKPDKIVKRDVLALYDTYEGGLKPIHSRSVARAAPLCYAFDLNLALMGFPSDDLKRIVDLSMNDTNIGRGGRYIDLMMKEGRIRLIECTDERPPTDWNDLGLPVATTSRPHKDKTISLKEARETARKDHPSSRVCLIMGLGKRGLPASLLETIPYHLEITGMNVPLETATAMGILAHMLGEVE